MQETILKQIEKAICEEAQKIINVWGMETLLSIQKVGEPLKLRLLDVSHVDLPPSTRKQLPNLQLAKRGLTIEIHTNTDCMRYQIYLDGISNANLWTQELNKPNLNCGHACDVGKPTLVRIAEIFAPLACVQRFNSFLSFGNPQLVFRYATLSPDSATTFNQILEDLTSCGIRYEVEDTPQLEGTYFFFKKIHITGLSAEATRLFVGENLPKWKKFYPNTL